MSDDVVVGSRRAALWAGAGILALASVLVFVRLDQRLLWIDEAETALLGRSVLVHGVPVAFDGRNLISQEVGREFGPSYVWRWTPWLEKYLVAGSFALFGESTWTARLPFALLGLFAVAAVYPLAVLLFRDRRVGVLAMAFLTLSVPFLLHVRQCRYYSPIVLGTIGALYCFVGLGRGARGAVAGSVAAMSVLFHSNLLTFLATGAALAPCALVLRFDRRAYGRAATAAAILAIVNGPWVYLLLLGKTGESLYSFAENLRYQWSLASRYTLPTVVIPLFLAVAWLGRRRHPLIDESTWRPFVVLVVIPVVFLTALSAAPWSFYRYTVGLLPLAAILLAFVSVRVWAWNRVAGVIVGALLLVTGVPATISAWPIRAITYKLQSEGRSFPVCDLWFPLGNYLYELSHPVYGPMEELVGYLRAHARAGDRVFISYGDLVVAFYTGLEVRGGQSGRDLAGWAPPEWFILRSFFRFGDRAIQKEDAQRVVAWIQAEVPRERYDELPLAATDFPWDDIAEPDLHWFRVAEGGKSMELFRLSSAQP